MLALLGCYLTLRENRGITVDLIIVKSRFIHTSRKAKKSRKKIRKVIGMMVIRQRWAEKG